MFIFFVAFSKNARRLTTKKKNNNAKKCGQKYISYCHQATELWALLLSLTRPTSNISVIKPLLIYQRLTSCEEEKRIEL